MKKIFELVCFYICTIIGASFITGNEVFVYFARYGDKAYALLAFCFVVFVSLSLIIFLKMNKANCENISDAFICKPSKFHLINAGSLFTFLCFSTYFAFASLMLAGLKELFGLPFCVITICVSFFLLQYDLKGLVKINLILFPLVVVYLIALLILILPSGTFPLSESAQEVAGVFEFLNVIPYVTLNVLLLCGSVLKLTNRINPKQIMIGTISAIILLTLFIGIQIFILQKHPILDFEMPLLEISRQSVVLFAFTLAVTFLAMISSFLSSTYAIYAKFRDKKNKYFRLVVLFSSMLICSFFGFNKIIIYSYAILGILSLVLILVLIFKKI